MLQWQFAADNDALRTDVGVKEKGRIRLRRTLPMGLALAGPGIDVPAGALTARVLFDGPSRGKLRMEITAGKGATVLAAQIADLGDRTSPVLELSCAVPADASGIEVRLSCRGFVEAAIVAVELDLARAAPAEPGDPDRRVGFESRKNYAEMVASGFLGRYLAGPAVLELGYKGYEDGTVPIVPQAIGVDVGYPGYDGSRLPFADESFDAIYSSHCYEHIAPWKEVLQDWHRILKVGGHLIIVVPHQHLFERKLRLPSPINPDHKRFYTASSLCAEIEAAFVPNTYRVRHLTENDRAFDYNILPYQGTAGSYEIELVVEKLARPFWNLVTDAVRPYAASEFFLRDYADRSDPWGIPLDLTNATRCEVWGPYVGLGRGDYEAEFHFELSEADKAARPEMLVDVGQFGERIAEGWVRGDTVDAFLATGKVIVPFSWPDDDGIFEFRVWAGGIASAARPKFKGVVVRYQNRGTYG